MTAAELIEKLQALPPATLIFVFDPKDASRYLLDRCDTLDYWSDGYADLNLLATNVKAHQEAGENEAV